MPPCGETYVQEDGHRAAAGEAAGGVVRGHGRGVRLHGHGQAQRGVAAALHRPLRVLQVPHAVGAGALAPPPRGAAPNGVEFFPEDIGAVLAHPLSRGTFPATVGEEGYEWRGAEEFLATPPESWAVDERAVRARPVPPGVVRVRPRRGRCSRQG
jgi:hypothetical protein